MWKKKTILLALACFLAAMAASYLLDRAYPRIIQRELLVVPDRKISELLSLDHRGFLADLLFIQVNLHSGSLMWKPLKIPFDSDWAYGTIDLITDLDPRYYIAYLYAGMGLIHRFDDVKRARKILEKGNEGLSRQLGTAPFGSGTIITCTWPTTKQPAASSGKPSDEARGPQALPGHDAVRLQGVRGLQAGRLGPPGHDAQRQG